VGFKAIAGSGWLILTLLIGMSGGCHQAQAALTVAAAADLTDAFAEIGQRFTVESGIAVRFNFGSTGQLAQQIEQGADVDVFAAASVTHIEDLERKGRMKRATRRFYGLGRLVIWSREESPLKLEQIEDLRQPGIRRIAIANPEHAPYGIAAREALIAAGVWPDVYLRIVPSENVRQALRYAETGDADVALVARSLCREKDDARGAAPRGRWSLIPASLHAPLNQAMGVVAGTRHEAEAQRFIDYVTGREGRAILARYGFNPPESESGR
jgi:molybdate transport system substrate-binding protein